jgi:putative thioredoxin
VVDAFGGAIPESQLRTWLDRLLLAGELATAEKLEATDPAAAEAKYRELLTRLQRESAVQIGLGRVLLVLERNAEAQEIVTKLEARGFLEPEAEKLKAALELAGMRGGDLTALTAAANANPNDLDAKLALAHALAGAGRHEEALQTALAILEVQKTGPGDQAKQLMLDIFRVLPSDSELTRTYRRKLTSLLY